MTPRLLLVLIVMFLTACGTRTMRDDSPASDLDALVNSVSRDLRPRLLPNGREYCAELALTQRAHDECTGDLEDALYSANRDKERADRTLRTGVARIKLSRNPCGRLAKFFRLSRCNVETRP